MPNAIHNDKSYSLNVDNLLAEVKQIKALDKRSSTSLFLCILNQLGTLRLGAYNPHTGFVKWQTYPLLHCFSTRRKKDLDKILSLVPVKVKATVVVILMQKIFRIQMQIIQDIDPKCKASFAVKNRLCDLTLDEHTIVLSHEQLIQKTKSNGVTTFFKIRTGINTELKNNKSKTSTQIKGCFTKECASIFEAVEEDIQLRDWKWTSLMKDLPTEQEVAFYALQQKLEGSAQGNLQYTPFICEMLSSFQSEGKGCVLEPIVDISSIFLAADQLSFLKTLSMDNFHLKSFPIEMTQLVKLEFLSLDGNDLASLPSEMTKLTNLRRLSLRENSFDLFPGCLVALQQLREISFDDNKLKEIPPSISQLTRLVMFDLQKNRLSSLPPEMRYLSGSLKHLTLSKNRLTSYPPVIGHLTSLTFLSLSENWVRELPDTISNLTSLNMLILDNVGLQFFPPSMQSLSTLRALFLKNNYLGSMQYLPQSIRKLDLENTGLEKCPEEVANLPFLEAVNFKNNRLNSFPNFVNPALLKLLNFEGNEFSTFPEATFLKQFTSHTKLGFSNNKLTQFPEEAALTLSSQLLIGLNGNPFSPTEFNDWHRRVTAPNWQGPNIELNPSSTIFF